MAYGQSWQEKLEGMSPMLTRPGYMGTLNFAHVTDRHMQRLAVSGGLPSPNTKSFQTEEVSRTSQPSCRPAEVEYTKY